MTKINSLELLPCVDVCTLGIDTILRLEMSLVGDDVVVCLLLLDTSDMVIRPVVC